MRVTRKRGMNVNEIKQEILDLLILNGRKPQTIKNGERVVYLYDALNIVNKEFSKTEQSQLNDNQQIVLEWLKLNYDCDGDHEAMWNIFMMYYYHTRDSFTDRLSQAIENLTNDEQIEILREYSQWALEQEG